MIDDGARRVPDGGGAHIGTVVSDCLTEEVLICLLMPQNIKKAISSANCLQKETSKELQTMSPGTIIAEVPAFLSACSKSLIAVGILRGKDGLPSMTKHHVSAISRCAAKYTRTLLDSLLTKPRCSFLKQGGTRLSVR